MLPPLERLDLIKLNPLKRTVLTLNIGDFRDFFAKEKRLPALIPGLKILLLIKVCEIKFFNKLMV
ncbi:hypothetical protein AHMF7605_27565 [Adhaeribacter arboris]|uniref:Uncharacterized protein n=1 Tax=Adhaeribacter arboris TaxID=2072846 RepID=A0A2T2YNB9_9BACT|nr:hypothetical protein AHMF7605_27565 [Adhaeribacter arboris]